MVAAYQAMRGVSFLVAVTFAAEIGDVRRFDTPAMAQQERQQLLALASKVVRHSHATTHQIAHRLTDAVWHPDPRQLAGAKQSR